jgi:hypothetical protein
VEKHIESSGKALMWSAETVDEQMEKGLEEVENVLGNVQYRMRNM